MKILIIYAYKQEEKIREQIDLRIHLFISLYIRSAHRFTEEEKENARIGQIEFRLQHFMTLTLSFMKSVCTKMN